ncbi:MAG: tRNA (adenosine(37)-N6)-dimethylallyltransferase MiaA [Verrucomicrobiales bacterium]|nr:tRNA (adenosine(37)-N6)-dimethylallyltransferase MiaA [Verrucomicrobiales bacterium]
MITPRPPIYLAGQTGCGKTAVALEIARQLGAVEIINADAYQVYRGLEILSAAPDADEREQCPHHLFGILDPGEECDAATFANLARTAIAEVATRATPLLVGGSGLYLKAITHGLAPTPKSDPILREKLDQRTLESLIEEYEALDPGGAAQTNLKNRRYVTRNLEISLLSGQPASQLKKEWENNAPELDAVYLFRDREVIYDRINRRTHAMMDAGVIDEIAALSDLSATAAKAIGIREIKAHLAGELSREEMIEQIQQTTRRYAKRQASWFKRETAFRRIEISNDESPAETAGRILGELGRTRP